MTGHVYLVGAGPGDPELLTVKADRIIRNVDLVLYDRLISDELIDSLPGEIETIYCGKKANSHRLSQDEINRKLLNEAETGKEVARLKGGDPLLFGRGGEEYRYLNNRDIDVTIVPGITAATASTAELGLPLTDREVASEVTFLTGHEAPEKGAESLDWECLANCRKTLVVYMGVNQLQNIASTLIEQGRNPETPAIAVEKATFNNQRILKGTLNSLPDIADVQNLTPPAVIVIGEVGKLIEDGVP